MYRKMSHTKTLATIVIVLAVACNAVTAGVKDFGACMTVANTCCCRHAAMPSSMIPDQHMGRMPHADNCCASDAPMPCEMQKAPQAPSLLFIVSSQPAEQNQETMLVWSNAAPALTHLNRLGNPAGLTGGPPGESPPLYLQHNILIC
jgi:hypothetical protein